MNSIKARKEAAKAVRAKQHKFKKAKPAPSSIAITALLKRVSLLERFVFENAVTKKQPALRKEDLYVQQKEETKA